MRRARAGMADGSRTARSCSRSPIGQVQSDRAAGLDILAFVAVERLRFSNPVFIGDAIRTRQTVRSLDVVNSESAMLETGVEVVNRAGVVAVSYVAKFFFDGRRRAT